MSKKKEKKNKLKKPPTTHQIIKHSHPLFSSTVPSQWKEANIIPVHKKSTREALGNYRPVSLLFIVSKVLER